MKRSEAERLLIGLKSRRQDAIDAGDFDRLARLDDKIAEVEVALEGRSSPPTKRFRLTPLRILGALLLAMWAGSLFADPGDPPEYDHDNEQAERGRAIAAESEAAARQESKMPTATSVRIAAEMALEELSADPESIDVRSCGVADTIDRNDPPSPLPYSCEFAGRNGFGGMVIQRADLLYYGVGNATVTAIE